jgi:3-dehydroquinate synthase
VVGDLAGYVAAAYMRGVPFIQMPTSLLAMVDSSVGGKVAVNHALGKNMIGHFYQPEGVWMSTNALKTLPERELRAGLGEVLKYGIIMDAPFFTWLESHVDELLTLNPEALTHVLQRSVECKAEVVAKDEREGGLRAILNLGHTFGHAEEVLAGYGVVLHGEAVAAGMIAAMQVAVKLGQATQAEADRVRALVNKLSLPTELTQWASQKDAFWLAMQGDKKSEGGDVKFVISRGIGACDLPVTLGRDLVEGVLENLVHA